MGGKSSSKNSTTNNSQNNSSQVGVSGDNEGIILSGLQDSSVVLTDHGAVQAGADVAGKALESNADVLNDAFKFGAGTVGEALDFGESSLDFGEKALDSAFDFSEKSLTEAYGFGEDALGSVTEALRASNSLANQSMQFANTVNASKATDGASDMADRNNKLIIALFGLFVLMIMVVAVKGRR